VPAPLIPTLLAAAALIAPGGATAAAPDERAGSKPFEGSVTTIPAKARDRMKGVSWHDGCPVGLGALRRVNVTYVDFDGDRKRGRLVVHRSEASEILEVFERLYAKRFPFRRIEPVERYDGDDHKSMDADNTSAFNCRVVNGTSTWSQHAYGKAIDINPRENPYVTSSGHVSPPAGAQYTDRDDVRKGMVVESGPVVRSMQRIAGWKWGGDWNGTKDYQHFSENGR
jgi:hypothetical protein